MLNINVKQNVSALQTLYLYTKKHAQLLKCALIERKKLELNGREDVFLSILGDKFSRQILSCIVDRPKTASEISSECGILLSMVYRRLQFLEEANVLTVTGMIGQDGKKRFAYQSKISGISASFDKDTIVAKVKPSVIAYSQENDLRT